MCKANLCVVLSYVLSSGMGWNSPPKSELARDEMTDKQDRLKLCMIKNHFVIVGLHSFELIGTYLSRKMTGGVK